MKIENLPVESIISNNWNQNEMDESVFHSLVESIRKYGVLQPILVRSDLQLSKVRNVGVLLVKPVCESCSV